MMQGTGAVGISPRKLLIVLGVLVALAGFGRDVYNTLEYGGTDLRDRVVPARVLARGMDPYHFKWKEGMPDTLLDPREFHGHPVSRVAVPPSALVLHIPFAELPYRVQRILWLAGQWGLLLLSAFLLASCADAGWKRDTIWILALVFIAGSVFWRLHVERGQVYVLWTAFFCLAYRLAHRETPLFSMLSGFVLGFAGSCRPPLAFAALPLAVYRRWRILSGFVAGLAAGIAVPFLYGDSRIWVNYHACMRYLSKIYLGLIPDVHRGEIAPGRTMIEGMDNLRRLAYMPWCNSSVRTPLSKLLPRLGVTLTPGILTGLLLVALTAMALYLLWNRRRTISTGMVFLLGIVVVFVSEYFMPVRNSYADVIWLVPLALIVVHSEAPERLLRRPLLLAVLALLLAASAFSWMPKALLIADYAMPAYVCLATARLLSKQPRSP